MAVAANGVPRLSAARPENGLQGGLVLGTVAADVSDVILALALCGRGFIPFTAWTGGPLELAA